MDVNKDFFADRIKSIPNTDVSGLELVKRECVMPHCTKTFKTLITSSQTACSRQCAELAPTTWPLSRRTREAIEKHYGKEMNNPRIGRSDVGS